MPDTRRLPAVPPALGLILAAFAALGVLWAWRIPVPTLPPGIWGNFNPDESNHLNVIRYMALRHGLPPYVTQYQISQHPPLYHGLYALVYALITPRLGYFHTVLLLRLLSVCMGLGTVWLTYRAALSVLSPPAAVLAAGCAAGVPMFVSLSAAVNNDDLAALASAGALAAMVAGTTDGFDRRRLWTLALWTAAAMSTKVTCLPLFPALAFALWWDWRRRGESLRPLLGRYALVAALSLGVIGWWYARNQWLYGDPLRAGAHRRMWGALEPSLGDFMASGMSPLRWLTKVFGTGWKSFWGVFDAMRLHLPAPAYALLFLLNITSAVGLIRALRGGLKGDRAAAAGVLTVFCVSLLALYVGANASTYTPQGRYLFPALLPFGLATAVGWRALFPPRSRDAAGAAVLIGLLLLNVFCVISMTSHQVPI